MNTTKLFDCIVPGNIVFRYPPTLPEPHVQHISVYLHRIQQPWRKKSQRKHDPHKHHSKFHN